MWTDFSDVDLIRLSYDYCLDYVLELDGSALLNRDVVELALSEYEYENSFA